MAVLLTWTVIPSSSVAVGSFQVAVPTLDPGGAMPDAPNGQPVITGGFASTVMGGGGKPCWC